MLKGIHSPVVKQEDGTYSVQGRTEDLDAHLSATPQPLQGEWKESDVEAFLSAQSEANKQQIDPKEYQKQAKQFVDYHEWHMKPLASQVLSSFNSSQDNLVAFCAAVTLLLDRERISAKEQTEVHLAAVAARNEKLRQKFTAYIQDAEQKKELQEEIVSFFLSLSKEGFAEFAEYKALPEAERDQIKAILDGTKYPETKNVSTKRADVETITGNLQDKDLIGVAIAWGRGRLQHKEQEKLATVLAGFRTDTQVQVSPELHALPPAKRNEFIQKHSFATRVADFFQRLDMDQKREVKAATTKSLFTRQFETYLGEKSAIKAAGDYLGKKLFDKKPMAEREEEVRKKLANFFAGLSTEEEAKQTSEFNALPESIALEILNQINARNEKQKTEAANLVNKKETAISKFIEAKENSGPCEAEIIDFLDGVWEGLDVQKLQSLILAESSNGVNFTKLITILNTPGEQRKAIEDYVTNECTPAHRLALYKAKLKQELSQVDSSVRIEQSEGLRAISLEERQQYWKEIAALNQAKHDKIQGQINELSLEQLAVLFKANLPRALSSIRSAKDAEGDDKPHAYAWKALSVEQRKQFLRQLSVHTAGVVQFVKSLDSRAFDEAYHGHDLRLKLLAQRNKEGESAFSFRGPYEEMVADRLAQVKTQEEISETPVYRALPASQQKKFALQSCVALMHRELALPAVVQRPVYQASDVYDANPETKATFMGIRGSSASQYSLNGRAVSGWVAKPVIAAGVEDKEMGDEAREMGDGDFQRAVQQNAMSLLSSFTQELEASAREHKEGRTQGASFVGDIFVKEGNKVSITNATMGACQSYVIHVTGKLKSRYDNKGQEIWEPAIELYTVSRESHVLDRAATKQHGTYTSQVIETSRRYNATSDAMGGEVPSYGNLRPSEGHEFFHIAPPTETDASQRLSETRILGCTRFKPEKPVPGMVEVSSQPAISCDTSFELGAPQAEGEYKSYGQAQALVLQCAGLTRDEIQEVVGATFTALDPKKLKSELNQEFYKSLHERLAAKAAQKHLQDKEDKDILLSHVTPIGDKPSFAVLAAGRGGPAIAQMVRQEAHAKLQAASTAVLSPESRKQEIARLTGLKETAAVGFALFGYKREVSLAETLTHLLKKANELEAEKSLESQTRATNTRQYVDMWLTFTRKHDFKPGQDGKVQGELKQSVRMTELDYNEERQRIHDFGDKNIGKEHRSKPKHALALGASFLFRAVASFCALFVGKGAWVWNRTAHRNETRQNVFRLKTAFATTFNKTPGIGSRENSKSQLVTAVTGLPNNGQVSPTAADKQREAELGSGMSLDPDQQFVQQPQPVAQHRNS